MDYNELSREQIDVMLGELYKERMKRSERELGTNMELKELLENSLAKTPANFPESGLIACPGISGSNTEEAATRIFKYPSCMYFKNFEGVFAAIDEGLCEYGVLPIENSYAGSINTVYDLLIKHKCYIVRSIKIRVEHNLMVKKGCSMDDVTEIVSHQQALLQCNDYLKKNYPSIRLTACTNTAEAARMVAEGDGSMAAICAGRCEDIYDLRVVDSNIQDSASNYTRFICISKTPQIYPGADKTSIRVITEHTPGSLLKVINAIVDNGYNMTKLESRPIPSTDFDFSFYFDFDAAASAPNFVKSLVEIDSVSEEMIYLGSYQETL